MIMNYSDGAQDSLGMGYDRTSFLYDPSNKNVGARVYANIVPVIRCVLLHPFCSFFDQY